MNILIILIISGISLSLVHAPADGTGVNQEYAFKQIFDQDSTRHQYVDIREGDNWCWMHNTWENVRIVNPSGLRRKEEEE
tara:strand:- start:2017 stop:2256 length:240 start_codon:yes stop_codon:yes gene_type:complete